ncbi:MAG: hypothetical protein H3C43_04785 [Leptonema sp. (in: Bacteria)]|nr:hypothetical protein [Leptonema sp. (in: bacteria)]
MSEEIVIETKWQNRLTLALNWMIRWVVQWARINIVGWAKVITNLILFLWSVAISLTWQFHIFIVVSFVLAVLPIFPWFQYTLTLGQTESYQMTTNLWYLFFLPGAVGLIFATFPMKRAYQIQILLSGFILLLFIYSYFFPDKTHYNILDKVTILPSYYIYFAVLIVQLAVTFILKIPKNSILIQIKQKWATLTI